MAYPRPRGDNPLNFEEYDPTPFSGGYDQTALYGRPNPPSAQTCYPPSDNGVGSGYGSHSSPYGSGPKYAVDESRPVYKQDDPPHGSGDDFQSGYGKPKPSFGFEPQEGFGHGRPKPQPARHESEYEENEGYQPEYGRLKPRPSNDSFFEEPTGDEGGFGGPKPSFGRPKPAYSQEGDEGYGYSKPSYGSAFGAEESYEGNYQKPPPIRPEESFGGGYGGRKPSSYESEEGRYGNRPGYGGFGGEQPADEAGYRKNTWEEEGDHHHGHAHKEHHKHHWRNDDE